MAAITIQNLYVHPVKSLRAVELVSSPVEPRGLRHDRRWMLVDPEGSFLTQRSFARMATIGMRIHEDRLEAFADGLPDLHIAFDRKGEPLKGKVWGFEGKVLAVSDEADAWFSEALETSCRLVGMPETTRRQIHPAYGKGEVAFADAMPILVTSQESLGLLNSKLDEPLPMNRFRANIVVQGASPHEEDLWERMRIGQVVLRKTKKCGRCLVTTTDQQTGERGTEPLRTLAEYRKDGKNVYFGSYYVPEVLGTLAVGDAVEV